jgi:hypothetical protein
MKRAKLFTHQLLFFVFLVLMFGCQSDKVQPDSKKELTYPVVVNGKSYSKNQIKHIFSKIGILELSKEEKVVLDTIGKNFFSSDKTKADSFMNAFADNIVGEMQKLTDRRLRTVYYGRIKRELKIILPKEEYNTFVSNVSAKLDSVWPDPFRSLTPSQRIKYTDSLIKNFNKK